MKRARGAKHPWLNSTGYGGASMDGAITSARPMKKMAVARCFKQGNRALTDAL
jgi:hypothetical protein